MASADLQANVQIWMPGKHGVSFEPSALPAQTENLLYAIAGQVYMGKSAGTSGSGVIRVQKSQTLLNKSAAISLDN